MSAENVIWLIAIFGIVAMLGVYAWEQQRKLADMEHPERVTRRAIDAFVHEKRRAPGIYVLARVPGGHVRDYGICILPDGRWTDEYPASKFHDPHTLRPCPPQWREWVNEQIEVAA